MIFFKNLIRIFILCVFGLIYTVFSNEVFEKLIHISHEDKVLKLFKNVNSIVSFAYPFLHYIFFVVLYNISYYVTVYKKNKRINDVILISIFPNYIFILINYLFIINITSEDLDSINNYERAIIPFINYSQSAFISEVLFCTPSIVLLLYFIKTNESITNSLLVALLPMILIYFFNYLM